MTTAVLNVPPRTTVKFSWSEGATDSPDLELELQKVVVDDEHLDEYFSPKLPGVWAKELGEAQLRATVQCVIELDFLLRRRFDSGEQIRVRVPAKLNQRAGSRKAVRRLDDLVAHSASPGQLVRPFLLNEPDLSYLYPFQVRGVAWLQEKQNRLLADDMGLGKTLQAITAIRELLRSGKVRGVLILAPKSLVYNWLSEFQRWAPELFCVAVNAQKEESRAVWRTVFGQVHVVISHYEEIRAAAEHLRESEIDLLVADEAHRLRNESSQLTTSVRHLCCKRMWALTGTPIERDAEDLATLMSLLDPQRFASSDSIVEPALLRSSVQDYVLSRRRMDVLQELPAVTERIECLELLPEQRDRYEQVLAGVGIDGNPVKGTLSMLNELRKICDYDPVSGQSSKLIRVLELVEKISDLGEKAIVFSYLRRPLQLIAEEFELQGRSANYSLLDGTMSAEDRDAAVQAFREREEVTVLLASSKIAGEGLTLTEANHVLFFNQWWNPSNNYQARDRVNRIGQTRPVNVYTFVCESTVEECLQEILDRKDEVFSQVIGKLADVSGPLTAEERKVVEEIECHLRGVD